MFTNQDRNLLSQARIRTIASLFLLMIWTAAANAQEWPEGAFEDGFWQEILEISEEEPDLEGELIGPTAVQLPFAEESTTITWQTSGDVSVYVNADTTDGWVIQGTNGTMDYKGVGIAAFLPRPNSDATFFIFGRTTCGEILRGGLTTWSAGTHLTAASASTNVVTVARAQATTDASLAVTGFQCPSFCPNKDPKNPHIDIGTPKPGYDYINSRGSGLTYYVAKVDYKWTQPVVCRR